MGNIPSTAQSQANKPSVATNFQLLRKIDDPHYGEIRLVRDSKTGEQIYLKEIVFDRKDAYQAELIFFNKRLAVSHPNIVRILGCTGSDSQTFCSGYYKISVFIEVLTKTLADEINIRLQTGIPFSENDILVVAENLIAGLSYFETQNIFHGDIRPENIFATTHSYKLSDPYLSLQKNANALSHAILGTAKTLLGPQLLVQVPRQDFNIDSNKFKADVFSLGMVLLSMASLTSSEELYDYERGLLDLYELRRRLEVVRKSYSKFTYDTIRSMLKVKEEERPDFIWLSNRLLPYQEDIRRKSEMQFFGVRAPGEEVDENAEDFFRAAFTELQQKMQADYELEDQLEHAKKAQRVQRTEKKVQAQENIEQQNSSRIMSRSNIEDVQNNSSYIASITSTRLDQQPQAKRHNGGIFGGAARQGPTGDENVEIGMPSHKKQRDTQSFVQNQAVNQNQRQAQIQRQQQEIQRQQEQQRQLQQQEEQQRQLHIQQQQQQLQRQRQQEQLLQQQKQQQMLMEQQRQQEQLLQQQQYEQEQQRQRQFQMQQQEQLRQRQSQQRPQMQEQNKMSSPQKSALATRQTNVESQSNIKTRSPFGKRERPSADVQAPGQFQPQIHIYNVPQNQIPQIAQLQDQRLVSNQKDYSQQQSQQRVEPVPVQQNEHGEFDDLEAKIQAALQRSNTTFNMAYKNLDEPAQTTAKPLVIQTENSYTPSDYGAYEAPLTGSGMISVVSPSQRTGENYQSIVDTLNMANIVKNHLPSSAYSKDPNANRTKESQGVYNASSGQSYYQQQGHVGSQQQRSGAEFVTYDANNEEEYGYNYSEGNEGYVIRKHGQTIVLNDF